MSIIVESDVPMPTDKLNRTKLPPEIQQVMENLKVGESFVVQSSESNFKRTMAACRSRVNRFLDRQENSHKVMSVRQEKNKKGTVVGVRVWRMEDEL